MSAIRLAISRLTFAMSLATAMAASPLTAEEPVPKTAPEASETPVAAARKAGDDAESVVPSWTLKYRFQRGAFLHFHSRSHSTMEVSARDVTQLLQESRETFKHYRVVAVDEDGSAVLEPVIDRTIMQARSDEDDWIIWDSQSTKPVPKRFQPVAKNVGRPTVRVRYKPSGEVDEVLPVSGSKGDLNPDKSSYGFLVRLPDEAVSIGDSWNDDFVVQVSPEPDLSRTLKKDVDICRVYTLKKITDGVAEISFRIFVRKPIRDPIIEAQLISRSLSGTVKFELKRGLMLEWSSAGSGQVFNPYGASSSLKSGLSSVERFSEKPLASSKPVAGTGPPRVASEPGRPEFARPSNRRKF